MEGKLDWINGTAATVGTWSNDCCITVTTGVEPGVEPLPPPLPPLPSAGLLVNRGQAWPPLPPEVEMIPPPFGKADVDAPVKGEIVAGVKKGCMVGVMAAELRLLTPLAPAAGVAAG